MKKIVVYGELKAIYIFYINLFLILAFGIGLFIVSLQQYISNSLSFDEALANENIQEAELHLSHLLKSGFNFNYSQVNKIRFLKLKDSILSRRINKIEIVSSALYIRENGFFNKNFAEKELIRYYIKLGDDYYRQALPLLLENYEKEKWSNALEKKHVIENLYIIYGHFQDYDKALPYLLELSLLEPEDKKLKIRLAEFYLGKTEYAKAEKILEEIVYTSNQFDEYLKKAGMMLLDIYKVLLVEEKQDFYFRLIAAKGGQDDIDFIKRYADYLQSYYNTATARKFLLGQYYRKEDQAIYEHLQSYK